MRGEPGGGESDAEACANCAEARLARLANNKTSAANTGTAATCGVVRMSHRRQNCHGGDVAIAWASHAERLGFAEWLVRECAEGGGGVGGSGGLGWDNWGCSVWWLRYLRENLAIP